MLWKDDERICPKTGRRVKREKERRWPSWLLPFVGLVSLLWFLIRVIPKPSRATYPCQRVVAPIASGFVVWLTGIIVSSVAYRKARHLASRARYVVAGFFVVLSVTAIWWSVSITTDNEVVAAFSPIDLPNSPIGVGKGIYPGRVVWVHDPSATTWDGVTGSWWDEQNLNQQAVDNMVSRALRTLSGQDDDAAAWDAIFRYFNRTRGAGEVGYQPGEKIAIKINMNQEFRGGNWRPDAGMPSPQMIHSLLAQLFDVVHVSGSDVTIYDASRNIGDPIFDLIHGDTDPNFQSVTFVSSVVGNGRIGPIHDPNHPIHFANPSIQDNATAYPPTCVTEAKYLINMPLLRAHDMFGITVSGKNWFGSIHWRTGSGWMWNNGWSPSPLHNYGLRDNPMGSYNCLVDLMGHPQLGGKTLLYLVDGLYGARNEQAPVIRYSSFGDHWTASVFASQDPIAIDSVVLDFLRNEPRITDCIGQGVDNYLHEAAQADDPPSGSFYDPGGTGSRLASLGVHEHWNNAEDKQYARNLGESEGIELVMPSLTVPDGAVTNIVTGMHYSYIRDAVLEAIDGDIIEVAPGIYKEMVSFSGKALWITSEAPWDSNVVAATVIQGATFVHSEDANSVLQGFTICGPGQGIYCEGTSPWIDRCCIVDNEESGIALWSSSNPLLTNCVIAGNGGDGIEMWATEGGRIVSYNHATILCCDILGNCGNGIRGGRPTVVSTIIWANGCIPGTAQIIGNEPIISYSNVQDGWPGEDNICADPLFAQSGYWDSNDTPEYPNDDFWVEGDYHLKSGTGRWDPNGQSWVQDDVNSPCIDAGDPNSDWGDELWPHGRRINMGAYGGTSQASMSLSNIGDIRDLNNDGLINWDDVLLLANEWDCNNAPLKEDMNRDGIVDVNDLVYFSGNWPDVSGNTAPVLDSIEDQYTIAGNELSFSILAIDTDGDELVYKALGLPEGAEFSEQVFSWTSEYAGTYFVTFIVSDYKSLDYLTCLIEVGSTLGTTE